MTQKEKSWLLPNKENRVLEVNRLCLNPTKILYLYSKITTYTKAGFFILQNKFQFAFLQTISLQLRA